MYGVYSVMRSIACIHIKTCILKNIAQYVCNNYYEYSVL